MSDILTQEHQNVKYDLFGWPINPATGESYIAEDLVADPDLPLPQNSFAARLIERDRSGESPPAARRRKHRRSQSGRPSRRINYAARVLDGPFGAGMEATAELVGRVNGEGKEESANRRTAKWTVDGETREIELDIPFDGGTPGPSNRVDAAEEYGLQPPF
jgi:hypothetical protein